jgi:hypothetical protein
VAACGIADAWPRNAFALADGTYAVLPTFMATNIASCDLKFFMLTVVAIEKRQ